MPEETVEEVVEQPVVEEAPVVEEEKKEEPVVEAPKPLLRRVIQPKDKDGNPVGSPHVYTGSTEQEIADKMADAISHGTLKIRELSLRDKMRSEPPEGAKVLQPVPEFKPRDLTADELFELQNKTPVEQFREIYKAQVGRTPEEDRAERERTERNSAISATQAAAKSFAESHPEYWSNPYNGNLMGKYLSYHKMSTVEVSNFEIAFRELSADGLLETEPVKEVEPEPVVPVKEKVPEVKPVVAEETPRTEAPAPKAKTAFPSAITRDQASGTGAVKPKKPSAAEIAMMNAEQYRAYLESQGLWGK